MKINCFIEAFDTFVLKDQNIYAFIWSLFFSCRQCVHLSAVLDYWVHRLSSACSWRVSPQINDDDSNRRGLLEGWRSASVSVCIISFNFHWIPWGGIVILYLTDADWVFDLSTCRWSWNTLMRAMPLVPGHSGSLCCVISLSLTCIFTLWLVTQLIRRGGDEVSGWILN